MTKTDLEIAYLSGMGARQAGKPREANAYRFRGTDGELLVERWFEGWDDQDAANRGTQHGVD